MPKIPELLVCCARILLEIRQPLPFLFSYILRKPLTAGLVEFRNGVKVYLSQDRDDLATVCAVFFRSTYTGLASRDVVIDVGANIGLFSIYAVKIAGAKKVYAFEPCQESLEFLRRNIDVNGLSGAVIPFRAAVRGSAPGEYVQFPVTSSPCNSLSDDGVLACEPVITTTLDQIVKDNGLQWVDYLKIDCEGTEYEIILEMAEPVSDCIAQIAVEYHAGRQYELIDFLQSRGFLLTRRWHIHEGIGLLTLRRPAQEKQVVENTLRKPGEAAV
ncbi:MAG: FkbM family methyltransferase [Acidobacteriia bacterium]|nr:FkbM family methyltransferase [Terriglobia bacterium]